MFPKTNEKTQTELLNAFKDGSEEAFGVAMTHFANEIQKVVLEEAKNENDDQLIMSNRGQDILTSDEKKYYNEVIDNEGFEGVETLVPKTVFERVFEDLKNEHPLLSKIQFVNTTGVAEFITSRGINPAWWGKLTSEIKEVLDNGFDTVDVKLFKLSGYIPVAKDMLDLGPTWLDRYVRTVLVESLQIGLENAIVDGDGVTQPIGMMRDIKNVSDGKHVEKDSTPLSGFTPEALGELMGKFSKLVIDGVENETYRNIKPEDVIMLVNPTDYWTDVYPAITIQLANDGSYRTGLPLPFNIIESVAVPTGKIVVGVAKDYFMGLGSGLQIGVSDEVKFIEDQRVYLAKQYANGQPKANDSFIVLDLPAKK